MEISQEKLNKGWTAKAVLSVMKNGPKKFSYSPRIKVIQKIYNSLMNPASK